ncbi:hypothetical protein N7474_001746 [Penicillium riverlandense]|uniref:uncharacterized protein n=1 Tax=Penicillium riverlandense TaxID=1903569 RepID=UPI002546BB99|nr:uncharacterized protein N7474_001746 [Penicillium riverlandense]KAJ5833435.1 hypothetical protein N7474_001746 [Penicillium riverlandense]
MQQHNGIPNILKLLDGTQAFWLGNPEADKLIIYIPGGGYCIPALPNHFSHVEALFADLKDHGKDIGVLFLIYDLAPGAQWPRQLEQAVSLLRYAIETLGKRPSDIVLQGDSSGAHLALAVLSHLAHPKLEGSVAALSLSENLGGAMLLSPWIDFRTHFESYKENAARDVVSAKSLGLWAQAVMGDFTSDEYSHPTLAPTGWWKDLPVARIFLGVGGDEVLLDSIVSFAKKLKAEYSEVSISLVPREFHVEPITDFLWKFPPGEQFQAMASWINQTFAQ